MDSEMKAAWIRTKEEYAPAEEDFERMLQANIHLKYENERLRGSLAAIIVAARLAEKALEPRHE